MNAKLNESSNTLEIGKSEQTQRLKDVKNESSTINVKAEVERQQAEVQSQNLIKKLKAELESKNIDDKIIEQRVMQIASRSLSNKYIE